MGPTRAVEMYSVGVVSVAIARLLSHGPYIVLADRRHCAQKTWSAQCRLGPRVSVPVLDQSIADVVGGAYCPNVVGRDGGDTREPSLIGCVLNNRPLVAIPMFNQGVVAASNVALVADCPHVLGAYGGRPPKDVDWL